MCQIDIKIIKEGNSMYYLQAVYAQISDKIGRISRQKWKNRSERSVLKNTDFTIFSQNCRGGIMYHDLGIQFQSPTVNMLFTPKDFIKFMKDIHYYLEQDIIFTKTDKPYPVGKVGGEIMIGFLHYHSEEEVISAWDKRKERINWNNIFVISCDEGLTTKDMKEFDELPYENKILFLSKANPEIKCGIYCKGFSEQTDARLLNFSNPFGKRYYQKYINYVKWLNKEKPFAL